ncbi:MAG: serine/threonine-protein kinase [Cyanobacteria bacterium J06621_11]
MTPSLSQTSASVSQATATAKPLFRNRFKIVRRLGGGGFSTAYLAEETIENYASPCVIKHLRYKRKPSTAVTNTNVSIQKERSQRRFQKEARIMARIGRHDQLPCLLDHFIDNEQFYLVQEYIPGPTLQQLLHQNGPFNEAQIKTFLQDIIPIIRYVHRHNLLHLDIKPANIIRRERDQKLVLIDFGAVRRYASQDAEHKPEPGTGTVGFAASEQFAGMPTPASDIYGLGVTCLYLLTGCNPLDLATSPKGQNLRWQESVIVSDHLNKILHKMLAPEAKQRFQSVDELERALNLEAHYDELRECMTREPLSSTIFKQPTACLIADRADTTAKSEAERQAHSIRRWQQRRRQFKSFVPK